MVESIGISSDGALVVVLPSYAHGERGGLIVSVLINDESVQILTSTYSLIK